MPAVLLRRDSITDDLTATGYRRVYAGCSAECVQQTSQRFIDGKGRQRLVETTRAEDSAVPIMPTRAESPTSTLRKAPAETRSAWRWSFFITLRYSKRVRRRTACISLNSEAIESTTHLLHGVLAANRGSLPENASYCNGSCYCGIFKTLRFAGAVASKAYAC